jgi:hypothetical protein
MIRFAIARPQDKKALETFVKKLCIFGKDNALARILFFDRSIYFEDMYDMVYLRFPYRSDDRQNLNLPRLWWKYDSTLYWYHVYLKIKIFQQRAWVFFEDDCYYPKDTTAVPVFPSKEHLDCMAQDLVNKTISSWPWSCFNSTIGKDKERVSSIPKVAGQNEAKGGKHSRD